MPTQGDVKDSNISPWAVQDRVNAQSARYAMNMLLPPDPTLSYVDYRSGVLLAGDNGGMGTNNDASGTTHMAMRAQAATGMHVTVEAGHCVINTAGQGAYMCTLDNVKTLTIAASSATKKRIDLVIARVYDDENATIGSAPGVRKFSVEVYQGDETTGTPSVPIPNFAGYIALAEVQVDINVTSITVNDVFDVRGPAIGARGTSDVLFGSDGDPDSSAYGADGANPGATRWVPDDPFPNQVFYGSGVDVNYSGWRGINNMRVYQTFCDVDFGWIDAGGNTTLCSMLIPYPGTPFQIYPWSRAMMRCSRNISLDMRINVTDTGTGNTDLVNWDRIDSGAGTVSANTDQWNGFNCPPVWHGPHNAAVHVWVELHSYRVPVANAAWRLDRYWETMLQCTIAPVTSPTITLPNEG